jgi:hypothetical protein
MIGGGRGLPYERGCRQVEFFLLFPVFIYFIYLFKHQGRKYNRDNVKYNNTATFDEAWQVN